MRENPFQYLKPVKNPDDFFGRKEEIKSIYRHILNLHSISVVGERKTGKTSLFLHLIHPQTLKKYEISSDNLLMSYIDISSCTLIEPSDLFLKFLECISKESGDEISREIIPLLEKESISFQDFEEVIAELNKNSRKVVFFLDEFMKISMITHGDIYSKLRYLAQMYDVTYVVSTLRDLRSLFEEEKFSISPFFNIFVTYQLRGLDEESARELITATFSKGGFEVDDSVVESIIKFSGTSPFFLKVACWHYFENLIKGHLDFDRTLINTIQGELEPHHEYNWDHLQKAEQAALLGIIENGKTDDSGAERSLERKGYVTEGVRGTSIAAESFHAFLERILSFRVQTFHSLETQIIDVNSASISESDRNALGEALSGIKEQQLHPDHLRLPVFEIIGYFEKEMREYCKHVLEAALGENWYKIALDSETRATIKNRIFKSGRMIRDGRFEENILDYAALEDLRNLVTKSDNWDPFFSRYFGNKKDFEVKMQEIIDIRNRVTHYHSVFPTEAVLVVENIYWIFTHMRI
ncbi:MAG: hypothetical protein WBA22_12470 [Candidatus Methanofastidiosia archaeon]